MSLYDGRLGSHPSVRLCLGHAGRLRKDLDAAYLDRSAAPALFWISRGRFGITRASIRREIAFQRLGGVPADQKDRGQCPSC
jgi:hypothetical protein